MNQIKVELDRKGITAYLTSASVKDLVQDRAQRIAQKAGPGYIVEDASTKIRARARVITKNDEARRAESKHGHLRRAIG